jgi:methionine-gamma-lyase
MHPESLMMSYGYKPASSEGSIKPPIFQTSTFVFNTAEEGKAFFEIAYGLREQEPTEELGMIYSRVNNPNLEILENRLCLWDKAEACAVFESGMAAISTAILSFVRPGMLILYSQPTYGGTDHFITHYLQDMGITTIGFSSAHSKEDLIQMVKESGLEDKLALIYIETPANPTNDIIDIAMCKAVADEFTSPTQAVYVIADNTYMGPLWSHPLQHGADIVLYSATKYIGGHSDLIAGAVLGSADIIAKVKESRTFFGNMPSPNTAWLLLRSLETLKIRMEKQAANAKAVAGFLQGHPKVKHLHYLGLLTPEDPSYELYKRQYNAAGAMLSFELGDNEADAFTFLNHLQLIKLAVSLGSTESLAEHPASMTHAGVCPILKIQRGITENLVRLSIGIEHQDDLIRDIRHALEQVGKTEQENGLQTALSSEGVL